MFDVDVLKDEVISEFIPSYQGAMILSGRENLILGLDLEGFFIKSVDGILLFRSTEFSQELTDLAVTENYAEAAVHFKDDRTGTEFVCNTAVSGKQIPWPDGRWENDKGQIRLEYPTRFYTTTRQRTLDEFECLVSSLRNLCKASVATGNPIRWC